MIKPDSRYSSTPVVVANTDRGRRLVFAGDSPQGRTFEFTTYQVMAGDTLDQLAFQQYDDGGLWWMIADANPEVLDWTDLTPGSVLRIPRA